MIINGGINVIQDLLAHLEDPDYCDVKIVGNDGEIPANKTILGMRSQYFHAMFKPSSNFVESRSGSVKMPYSETVIRKVVIYIYSGKMDCDDLVLGQLLELLDLLRLVDLTREFSKVEEFFRVNIKKACYPLSDCLEGLDDSSKRRLEKVEAELLAYLGENFENISKVETVGVLSQDMIVRLLEEKKEESSKTVFRFRTFVKWLSVNAMEADMKEEVLKLLDFNHFTTRELATIRRIR